MADNQNTQRYLKAYNHNFLMSIYNLLKQRQRKKLAAGLIVYYMHIDTDVIKKKRQNSRGPFY